MFGVFGRSEGQRFRELELLDSKWFDIQTSECYRGSQLFNGRLALMYDGRVEARTREQEYWNGVIYWEQKDENWNRDVKTSSEYKGTKTE